MDANLIYVKTAAGEEAVRQRTRVVQRNTRMVLILVDGNSTVAELCQKTGNVQLVESALQDLERDGLVALKLEQDSVWEQSRKLAEEIKAAAVNRLAKEAPREPPKEKPREEPIIAMQAAAIPAPEPFSVAPLSVAPFSTFGGQAPASMAPLSTFGSPPPEAPVEPTPALAEKKKEKAAGGFLAGWRSRKRNDTRDDGIGPIRKERSKTYISLPLAAALVVVGLFALSMLVFLLYPYDSHKPRVEAMLSRLAGQPIRVSAIRAELVPKPGIVLAGISGGDGGGAEAARIRLIPELFSLIGSHPVFSSVAVEGARLSEKVLPALPTGIADAFAGGASVTVRALYFNDLSVDVIGLTLNGLQAEFRPGDNGQVGPLAFTTADHSFKAVLREQAGGFAVDVEATSWQPVGESRFRFDSLQGQLAWDGRQFVVRSLDARIFDGSIQGTLTFDRQAGQVGMAGDLTVKRMNLQRLGDALGYGKLHEGELAASLRFGARASAWEQLLPAASGDGSFNLSRGALGGFDIVEAMRRGKTPVRGGATRYEQLSGNLRIAPEALRFADLVLASGLLRATGGVDLARDGKLSGKLDVEMRGSANVVRTPVMVSGSLKEPVLQGAR